MEHAQRNSQKEGFKKRLGKSAGKFAKEGSHWHWKLTFANTGREIDGYDKGILETNYNVFDRLKVRFFKGVMLNRHEQTKKLWSELLLGGNVFFRKDINATDNLGDTLAFSFRLEWSQEGNKKYRKIHFSLNPALETIFTKGQIAYFNELFGEWELAIKNQYIVSPVVSPQSNAMEKLAALVPDLDKKEVEQKQVDNIPKNIPQTEVRKDTSHGNVDNGRKKFTDFVRNITKLNFDLGVLILENMRFHSLDDKKLTLLVPSEKFIYEFEANEFYNDFVKLFKNEFGAIKLDYALEVPRKNVATVAEIPKTPKITNREVDIAGTIGLNVKRNPTGSSHNFKVPTSSKEVQDTFASLTTVKEVEAYGSFLQHEGKCHGVIGASSVIRLVSECIDKLNKK